MSRSETFCKTTFPGWIFKYSSFHGARSRFACYEHSLDFPTAIADADFRAHGLRIAFAKCECTERKLITHYVTMSGIFRSHITWHSPIVRIRWKCSPTNRQQTNKSNTQTHTEQKVGSTKKNAMLISIELGKLDLLFAYFIFGWTLG